MTDDQKAAIQRRKRVLTELSREMWEIIQETPGVGSLAPSLEQTYESLNKAKRVTIAMVVDAYERQREDAIARAGAQTETEESADRQTEIPQTVEETVKTIDAKHGQGAGSFANAHFRERSPLAPPEASAETDVEYISPPPTVD